jgi:ABC-2 type transport system permease protein
MILLFSVLLPASAMAREKERGTVEQLMVSPLTPAQIMLSKVLPMTCIVVASTAASVWIIVHGVLGVPLRGSVFLYLALSALFAVSASGIGLLIAAVSRNLAQVGLLSILVMPPMILFSGTTTPPESMPALLLPLMYSSPMFHYMNITYGILLKGNGIALIWDSTLALAGIGTIMFGLGMWRFRRQFG